MNWEVGQRMSNKNIVNELKATGIKGEKMKRRNNIK